MGGSIGKAQTKRKFTSVQFFFSPGVDSQAVDNPLESLLARCGVDAPIASSLVADGWTLDTFACCALDMSSFDQQLDELVGDSSQLNLLQKASLWASFKAAQSSQSLPSSSHPSSTSAPVQPSVDASSWNETFAPKLDASLVQTLKTQFLQHYPSELLTSETTPCLRLLSLVHNQIKTKSWRWVPWRYRMSVSKSEEIQGHRATEVPKLEGLAVHNLLIDDPPSLEISNSNMGLNSVRNMMEIHDRAIAICQGAHLANLKAYTQKFLSFLTQKLHGDSNLRTANILEAQNADQKIWGVIAELMSERQWTTDDSLHEMTHIRHDLPGLLQVRPKMPKSLPPTPSPSWYRPEPSNSNRKGKSKGKSVGGKSKGKVQWVSEMKSKDGSWKPLCMRFQSGKCNLSNWNLITCVRISCGWRDGLWFRSWSHDVSLHSALTRPIESDSKCFTR